MSARETILARIRGALADVPAGDVTEIPVAYERSLELPSEAVVELLAERVADYRARVLRVGPAELPARLAEVLAAEGARRICVPAGLEPTWVAGLDVVADTDLDGPALDALDGVVTGCLLAIAETGTIVLDGGPRSGRRIATLVPDLHVCVVGAGDVVGTVPEAMDALAAAGRRSAPLTLVSGPSATSDIELERVEGVHGPRRLIVLIVDEVGAEPTGS
jgi:L-lactate dehydrogenase complex protein LldG